MGRHVNYSGLVIAGVGFFLTRFTVTLAIYEDPVRFYLAGIVPLALGLGLAAVGVALTVAAVDPTVVRTMALWCVVGAVAMLVLVVLTLLGSAASGSLDVATVRSKTYFSTFLIGGSVGGTLTGLYASRTRQQRSVLVQQANRLVVLNRLLRHEVLNALTAIRGYATVDRDDHPEATDVIETRVDDIEETIKEVKYLAQRSGGGTTNTVPVDLQAALAESEDTLHDRHPEVDVSVGDVPDGLRVSANERLAHVFTHLLENAIVHAQDDNPTVQVTTSGSRVRVSVADDGDGLPAQQRDLLETGDIGEFDDPRTGYGLNVVRLLVESYGGDIGTDRSAGGSAITVVLPRVDTGPRAGPSQSHLTGLRPALPHLLVAVGAAALAGVVYGAVAETLGGSIAGIGVFYGTADPVVGWLTHEFHSVVFGFVFLSLVSLTPERYRNGVLVYLVVGLAWSVVVWVVAAGFVAPIWLRLLGVSVPVPNFTVPILASHLAWGFSLGLFTAGGYRLVLPWASTIAAGPWHRFADG